MAAVHRYPSIPLPGSFFFPFFFYPAGRTQREPRGGYGTFMTLAHPALPTQRRLSLSTYGAAYLSSCGVSCFVFRVSGLSIGGV